MQGKKKIFTSKKAVVMQCGREEREREAGEREGARETGNPQPSSWAVAPPSGGVPSIWDRCRSILRGSRVRAGRLLPPDSLVLALRPCAPPANIRGVHKWWCDARGRALREGLVSADLGAPSRRTVFLLEATVVDHDGHRQHESGMVSSRS